MFSNVVCPACAHGLCADCCGPGCYCDCQMPTELLLMENSELLAEMADEDDFRIKGFD